MTSLSRAAFLKPLDRKIQLVRMPEAWGRDAHVYVRELGTDELIALEKAGTNGSNVDAMLHIVIGCLCDEDGHPLLTMDDLPELKKKSGKVIRTIAEAALDLSGLGDDDDPN